MKYKAIILALVLFYGGSKTIVSAYAGTEAETAIFGTEILEGTYSVEVCTDASLAILNSLLTVQNGQMTLMLLCDSSLEALYLGSASDARESEEQWVEAVKNNAGNSTFTFGISVLNHPMSCASFDGKSKEWTDHTLLITADSLPEDVVQNGEGIEASELSLADGTYLIDVSLSGGSGRASIQSPAKLFAKSGDLTAEIVWSSNHYDYMILDKETYIYEGKEEFSTFYLPVTILDKGISVIADTTAMSIPHEITYQMTFASDSIVPVETSE